MRLFLLLALAVTLSGCCHTKPPVVVTKPADDCIVERPPLRPPAVSAYGPENGCPIEFEVCYDDEGAEAIATYTEHLIEWAAETWYRCGMRPLMNGQPTGRRRPPEERAPEPVLDEDGIPISAPATR